MAEWETANDQIAALEANHRDLLAKLGQKEAIIETQRVRLAGHEADRSEMQTTSSNLYREVSLLKRELKTTEGNLARATASRDEAREQNQILKESLTTMLAEREETKGVRLALNVQRALEMTESEFQMAMRDLTEDPKELRELARLQFGHARVQEESVKTANEMALRERIERERLEREIARLRRELAAVPKMPSGSEARVAERPAKRPPPEPIQIPTADPVPSITPIHVKYNQAPVMVIQVPNKFQGARQTAAQADGLGGSRKVPAFSRGPTF